MKVNHCLQNRSEPQCFRPAFADSQHVDAKGVLQSGLFIQQIHKILRVRIPAQFYDNTDALLGGLVGNIHDVLRLFALRQRRHVLQKFGDIHADHGIRNLGDDHIGLTALGFLVLHLAPDLDFAGAGLVDFQQFILVGHNPAGGEIRPLDITHQFSGGDIFIQHIGFHGIYDLPQVMGRRTGSHAHGDALGTVHQEIGNFYRQHCGLFLGLVKVRHEVHHILVQIRKKCLLGDLLKPCLRITHGGGAVPLNIAEVAVAVDERHPLFEILAHDHQGVVDGTVPVRMIFTHGITDDTGALAVRLVIPYAQLMHVVESSALHWF